MTAQRRPRNKANYLTACTRCTVAHCLCTMCSFAAIEIMGPLCPGQKWHHSDKVLLFAGLSGACLQVPFMELPLILSGRKIFPSFYEGISRTERAAEPGHCGALGAGTFSNRHCLNGCQGESSETS